MQIEEPIKSGNIAENNSENICIGIDFGTTNCVATFVRDKKIQTIEDENGDIIPSCIAFDRNGNILVGKNALEKISNSDYYVIQSVKRLIGGNQQSKIFDIFGKEYSPVQICAIIIGYIKEKAENYLGKAVNSCTITVPAYFDDNQRNDTRIAAKMANLEVKRVINEPTAAALAYGLDHESEGNYMVYDLGGGTFDISILQMQTGVFRVINTHGDVNLGGDDIDAKLLEYIITKHKINPINIAELQHIARNIKEYLSSHEHFSGKISINGTTIEILITRSELEIIAGEIVDKTIKIMQNAILDANIDTKNIKGMILVGGTTRMPIIREKIAKNFPVKILTDLDPDKIVGIGAGIKAAGKLSGFENILLDITPLSLGIETLGGVVEKVIYRNTPIPCSTTQYFTTSHEGQTGIVLNIVQGERELSKDCRLLSSVTLKGIPQMSPGMPKIAVKFDIDVDGILSVFAKEERCGVEISTEIKPMYGMDYQKMSDELIKAIENAKSDMQNRLMIESIENAKITINTIEKALDEDGDMLASEQISQIQNEIAHVESLYNSTREELENSLKQLEKISTPFLEDRVNKYLQREIIGKNTKEFS